jgi:lipopolysaccharide export system ATP-binding protein
MPPILEADGLVKIYGRRRVVDGVSLVVQPGEIVGLLGPNGAGKTTSFKMMCGLVKPDKGRVILQGTDVTRWPLHERSKSGGMGYLPQQSSVFAKLSTEENLKGMMQLLGFSRSQQKQRCNELLAEFKIEKIRRSKAGSLSGGERRRLEIARCLVSDPKIIMLDEPFAGIDPVTVQSVQVVIKNLASSGISVLITDHAAREILQITDRTYVVSEGRILCSGTADEIVTHKEVKDKYLGDIAMPRINEQRASKPQIQPHSQFSNPESESVVQESRPAAVSAPAIQTIAPNSDLPNLSTSNPDSTTSTNPAKPTNTNPAPTNTKPDETITLEDKNSPSAANTSVSNDDTAQRDILTMIDAVNQAIDKSAATDVKQESTRPKIVFSKPRRSTRKVVSPYKKNDLD